MPISNKSAFFAAVLVTLIFSAGLLGAVKLVDPPPAPSPAAPAAFPLVAGGAAAPIVLPPDAPEVVKIAARDLATDIAAVTGAEPEVLAAGPADADRPRIELVLAPDLAGRWEAFR